MAAFATMTLRVLYIMQAPKCAVLLTHHDVQAWEYAY